MLLRCPHCASGDDLVYQEQIDYVKTYKILPNGEIRWECSAEREVLYSRIACLNHSEDGGLQLTTVLARQPDETWEETYLRLEGGVLAAWKAELPCGGA